jgi:hypothetical protein
VEARKKCGDFRAAHRLRVRRRPDIDREIPFVDVLGRVTGSDPTVTDYILEEPAVFVLYLAYSLEYFHFDSN